MATMAANVCPTCNSPINAARASVARVRGARIVMYCSAACADERDKAGQAPAPAPARVAEASERVAETAVADAEPEPVAEHDYARPRPRGNRRRKIIALSAAIMAGGMAITIINAVSPSTPSDVSAAEGPRSAAIQGSMGEGKSRPGRHDSPNRDPHAVAAPGAAAEPAESPAAVDVTPEALFGLARDTLRQLMDSPSPRIQRIAAVALSRIGDEKAMAMLRVLVEQESVELRKVEIAYALARAGDANAPKILRRRLKHTLRDVRVDAARSLVQLGDDTGSDVLRQVLSLSGHRIGAAGLLARLGDQRGVAALRKELDSSASSDETRMRAAVALGRAGDASVRERLIAMLEDRRYHVGAADALASLGDQSAVPALVKQLALPSLRVRAAVALRRLGAPVDLEILGAALQNGSDPARVSAAEAILVLTGPKKLAERD
jgi:HEAT repeat protein